ncbi:uncharacterized protein LOC110017411 [Oryzias latipes]
MTESALMAEGDGQAPVNSRKRKRRSPSLLVQCEHHGLLDPCSRTFLKVHQMTCERSIPATVRQDDCVSRSEKNPTGMFNCSPFFCWLPASSSFTTQGAGTIGFPLLFLLAFLLVTETSCSNATMMVIPLCLSKQACLSRRSFKAEVNLKPRES